MKERRPSEWWKGDAPLKVRRSWTDDRGRRHWEISGGDPIRFAATLERRRKGDSAGVIRERLAARQRMAEGLFDRRRAR